MRGVASWAWATTRARAALGTLLGPEAAWRLRTAPEGAPRLAVLRDLGLEAGHPAEVVRGLKRRLASHYGRAVRGVPGGHGAILALARLHELENLQLVWRAATRRRDPIVWQDLWWPLGELATLSLAAAVNAREPGDLPALLAGTPYQALAKELIARVDDPVSGELAIDRFGTRRIVEAARALPARDRGARDLLLSVAAEREAELARRAARYGLPSDEGAPHPGVLRRARRLAGRRVLLGWPFCLAPTLAVLLLEEAQVRAVAALVEAQDGDVDEAVLEQTLAGSLLEAA